jgi:hypothetical protein
VPKKSLTFLVERRNGNGAMPVEIVAARSRESLRASLQSPKHVAVTNIKCLGQVAYEVLPCEDVEVVTFRAAVEGREVRVRPGDPGYGHLMALNPKEANSLQDDLDAHNAS